ncbi:MAG: hypothetical protein ACLTMP_04920 [Eggerthella lenta]
MDIQAIIDKVVGEVQQAPDAAGDRRRPGCGNEKITGHSLGDTDIAAVAEVCSLRCRKRAATSKSTSPA